MNNMMVIIRSEQFIQLIKAEIRVKGGLLPFRRQVPEGPAIPYYACKINEWLEICEHHDCTLQIQGEPSPRLPRRIIDVSSSEEPTLKLEESPNPKMRYMTLSYCWGPVRPQLTLTKDTLAELKTRISLNELPQTVKNAVLLARELSIQFLWVDALCIMQDDQADWVEESNRMKDIYANAVLVISADRAASCNDGFLPDRPNYERTVDIPITYNRFAQAILSPTSALFPESKRDIVKHVYNDTSFAMHKYCAPQANESIQLARRLGLSNHTLNRAWCLQETMLASRIVHFTPFEMIWECLEDINCECGGFENMKAQGIGSARKRQWTQMRRSDERSQVLRAWWSCVQQYNIRSLTKDIDKLPAISGLAQQMPQSMLGKYYAGIWECELPQGLLWETMGEEYDATVAIRLKDYVAPSWSWVSISDASIKRSFDMKPFAKLVDISYELATKSPYGPLKSASLTLETTSFGFYCIGETGDIHSKERTRSELESLQIPSHIEAPFTFIAYGDYFQRGKIMFGHILANRDSRDRVVGRIRSGGKLQDVFREYTHEDMQKMSLSCVIVGRDISDYGNDIYGCLIVKPSSPVDGAFERVGVLQISFDKAWDLPGVQRRVITLV
jgi:hypothetical protein